MRKSHDYGFLRIKMFRYATPLAALKERKEKNIINVGSCGGRGGLCRGLPGEHNKQARIMM